MISDLTKQPPRSPKLALGGVISLPRLFDKDEQLRQTTFLGWRDDKNAKEVVL
jgi:hypothetical protein